MSDQNGLMNLLSCFPCVPRVHPTPETPNIDKIKEILTRFKREDPDQTDVSIVDRVSAHDLCKWTQLILQYLPNVNEGPGKDQANSVVQHFTLIKKFYQVIQNAGFDPSPAVDAFFNSIKIYESIMSICFVVFNEHPNILKSITDQVTKATQELEGFNSHNCIALACCGVAILSRMNKILAVVDEKLGELGIVKIAEFFSYILEVFCNFFNVDLSDTKKLSNIAETIQDMVQNITNALRAVVGDSIPTTGRNKKWGPLTITEKIRTKLSKFENKSPIVERTMNSFEKFFKSVEQIDDNFETLKVNQPRQTTTATLTSDPNNEPTSDTEIVSAPLLLSAQIIDRQVSTHEEISSMGRLFQHLETILTYGILIFENEDEILNPLLDHVDECTRILDKFNELHPLYKILCGKNYLSKMKVVIKKIIKLLDESDLKFNSPKEFLAEFKKTYPNLLYLICDSIIKDKIKNKFGSISDPIDSVMSNALDGALNKFKKFF